MSMNCETKPFIENSASLLVCPLYSKGVEQAGGEFVRTWDPFLPPKLNLTVINALLPCESVVRSLNTETLAFGGVISYALYGCLPALLVKEKLIL